MDAKKDPGKFTIRFCISDPRQMKAVDELNAQGRLKAQFLTNAILHSRVRQLCRRRKNWNRFWNDS